MYQKIVAFVMAMLLGIGTACAQAEQTETGEGYAAYASAISAFEQGDYESAVSFLTDAMLLEPENILYRYERGMAYRRVGNISAAVLDYSLTIAFWDDDTAVYAQRAPLFIARGQYAQACLDLDHVLDRGSPTENDYSAAAYARCMLGRQEEAMAVLEKGLAQYPQSVGILAMRGIVHYQMGAFEAALADYQAVLDAGVEDHTVYYNMAASLFLLGRDEEAQQASEKSLAMGGQSTTMESAKEAYAQLLTKENTPSPEAQAERAGQHREDGMRLLQEAQYPEALEQFWQASELMPGSMELYGLCADGCFQLEFYTEAAEYYAITLSLAKDSLRAYEGMIDSFRAMGNIADEAILHGYLVFLNPENAQLRNNYAITLRMLMREERALKEYDKAIELSGDTAYYYGGRADLLLQMNRHEEAEADYRRCIALDPEDTMAYYALQICLALQGKPSEISPEAFAGPGIE